MSAACGATDPSEADALPTLNRGYNLVERFESDNLDINLSLIFQNRE